MSSFMLTSNTELENKILKVIVRIFNQREELLNNLNKLEIIFNKEDIEVYFNLQGWFNELRILSERSEIWLANFVNNNEKSAEIDKVQQLLKNIYDTFVVSSNEDDEDYGPAKRIHSSR
mmetsp:Transcript_30988/g.28190  ORF Transcript_30988/g.28190 Transcript_30988/m.28190 type:complete len:119 (+) Transcript_30988:3788-4144(+)